MKKERKLTGKACKESKELIPTKSFLQSSKQKGSSASQERTVRRTAEFLP